MKNVMEWSIKMLALIMAPLMLACCSSDDSKEQNVLSEEAEQIIKDIDVVSDEMSDIYLQAKNAAEMATHINEIIAYEQVDTAWAESDEVVAALKNGITISWYFPPEEDNSEEYSNSREADLGSEISNIVRSRAKTNDAITSDIKVCIINQIINDKSCRAITEYLDETVKVLNNWGYHVTMIPCEKFTPAFIQMQLADYNVVLLCTHGSYIEKYHKGNQHRMTTGLKANSKEALSLLDQEKKRIANAKTPEDKENRLGVCIIPEKHYLDYVFNGKTDVRYISVSEKWIGGNCKNFPDNSFMFSTVCHSLEGNHSIYDCNLKQVNLGGYFGFDNAILFRYSIMTSLDMLLSLMVMGSTAEGAYNILDVDHKYSKEDKANLIYCQREDNDVISMCDAMDLGLSVKWATRNLGAKTPFEYGDFYAWGETEPDTEDSGREYKYWTTGYHNAMEHLEDDISGNPKYDAATALLGKDWRMPTKEECEELIYNCVPISVRNGEFYKMEDWVSGSKGGVFLAFTDAIQGKKGGALYLPYYWNTGGGYWTSNEVPEADRTGLWSDIPHFEAYSLIVSEPGKTGTVDVRYLPKIGKDKRVRLSSIRPVYDPK